MLDDLPRLAPGYRITGPHRIEMRRLVVAAYLQGHSIRTIATETGRSYGWVHHLLREDHSLTLRKRGGRTKRDTP